MLILYYFSILIVLIANVFCGPTQIRVEQDNNKSFHIGPEARTTFELVEEYRPLSLAYNQKNRPRALHSPLNKPSYVNTTGGGLKAPPKGIPVDVLVDFTEFQTNSQQPQQQGRVVDLLNELKTPLAKNTPTSKKSQWLEWTRWSACSNSERVRFRQCLEINNISCEGSNVESQRCFSHQPSNIPFVKDPHVIEREIIGGEANSSL